MAIAASRPAAPWLRWHDGEATVTWHAADTSLPVPSRPEMNRARNAYDANSLHAGVARPWTRVIPWRRCLRASRHLGDVLCGGNVFSAAESAVQVIIRLTAGTTRFPAPGVIGLSPFCECGPGNTCRQFSTPGHGEILRFFDGLELIEPALVRSPLWRPDNTEAAEDAERIAGYGIPLSVAQQLCLAVSWIVTRLRPGSPASRPAKPLPTGD